MRTKLSLILLLFTTFTVIALTFLNFSQGASTFRGIQNANQKKNSKSAVNDKDFVSRRLQDDSGDSAIDNTIIIVNNSTNIDASFTNITFNSTNTTETSNTTTSTPSIPDSYLFSVNPTQVTHSVKISGALYYGISKIIAAGIRQKNIPPLPSDYNVTKFISTTYRKYSDHSVYMFKIKLANSNLKRVNANFTVYFNYTNKVYSLIWYSYHSYNYTIAELYPDVTSNATNSTNSTNSTNNSTNSTDSSTNSTDNTTQTTNCTTNRIPMTLIDIKNDNQTLNGLLYGIRGLVKTAIVQGQVPSDSNTFSLNNLTNAEYLPQGNGIRYWFYINLLEDYGYLTIAANFSILYNNNTQTYGLVSYSYISSNITLVDDSDSTGDSDNGDNSDIPGESDDSDGSIPIDGGSNGGDNQTNSDNSTDPSTGNSTLPSDGDTNTTDPNSPSNSANSTDPIDPSNPNGNDNSTNSTTGIDLPPTGGDNEEITDPTDPEDGGSETPETETSDDSSDSSDENESKGTGIKISADIKTEEKGGEIDINVHFEFGKDGSVKTRH